LTRRQIRTTRLQIRFKWITVEIDRQTLVEIKTKRPIRIMT
jgi:hypothetical protein